MPPLAVTEKAPRPPSVWVTQILLSLLGVLSVILILANLYVGTSISQKPFHIIANLVFHAILLVFPASSFFGVWGLAKRKSYGRWAGVVWLSVVMVFGVRWNFSRLVEWMQHGQYNDLVPSAAAFIAVAAIYGACAFLIYRLARGSKANAFFAPPLLLTPLARLSTYRRPASRRMRRKIKKTAK